MEIPCKIGDEVYAHRSLGRNRSKRVVKGKVTQMYFVGEEMRLAIAIGGCVTGEWGKNVFGTEEEAQEALKNMEEKYEN
jgi:hypothetical protein